MICCQTKKRYWEKSLLREEKCAHTHIIMASVHYGPPVVVHVKKQGGNIIQNCDVYIGNRSGTAVGTWKSLNGTILSKSSGT